MHGRQLSQTFRNTFAPVDAELQAKGMLTKPPQMEIGITYDICSAAYYAKFRETILCVIGSSGRLAENSDRLATWRQQLPELDTYLHQNGWRVVKDEYSQPLNQLSMESSIPQGATYTKQIDTAECTLDIFYSSVSRHQRPYGLVVYERCFREVLIFGGSP